MKKFKKPIIGNRSLAISLLVLVLLLISTFSALFLNYNNERASPFDDKRVKFVHGQDAYKTESSVLGEKSNPSNREVQETQNETEQSNRNTVQHGATSLSSTQPVSNSQTQSLYPTTVADPEVSPTVDYRQIAYGECLAKANIIIQPIKARLDTSWAYYTGTEARIRDRAAGTLITEPQIQRLVALESPPLYNAWDAIYGEYLLAKTNYTCYY